MYSIFITFILLLLGLYFVIHPANQDGFEGNKMHFRCPNILLQKGSTFYLYNNKLAKVPGVNPITFDSLQEYTEFVEWQRVNGIRCPILYLQQSYNTQGETVLKARPDTDNIEGGLQDHYNVETTKLLDAGRNNNNVNDGYPAYDEYNQNIGLNTPLDKMFDDADDDNISPSAMDTAWGGEKYSTTFIGKTKDTRIQNTNYISNAKM